MSSVHMDEDLDATRDADVIRPDAQICNCSLLLDEPLKFMQALLLPKGTSQYERLHMRAFSHRFCIRRDGKGQAPCSQRVSSASLRTGALALTKPINAGFVKGLRVLWFGL